MPELTVVPIAILVAALIAGIVLGWVFRGKRGAREKQAINLGWQEQMDAQRSEHERLLEQNKSLMEQNGQYQASNKDSKMRASELSAALKEAFERRDELQRQIKDIRNNLEATVSERDRLQSDVQNRDLQGDAAATALQRRDLTIAKLSKELAGWQARVPPLIERFRARNEEAERLEQELAAAMDRIAALESMLGSEETRVEPVNREALGEELDASNDAEDATMQAREPAGRHSHNDHRDDLQLIKGVGPAIEKTLNELGVYRFDQIAGMSEYDIDRVAQRLKGFRSRIYREDWIGQARDLLDQNLNGPA